MRYLLYNFADIYALPEYKADMGADMGGIVYRDIQNFCNRKIFIKNQKINEPVILTDSRMMS